MQNLNPQSTLWFEAIGYEKLTLLRLICRHGIITSNNIESINNRFRHVRRLPILESLMEVEKLVATDRASRFQHAIEWQTLTKYASKCLGKINW